MRKATKTVISFAVVLIAGLNFIIPAFAQDPFSAIAVGGMTGASAGGLFSSMAAGSGINIGFPSGGIDPLDAMYNVQNPDYVLFHGSKHEATNIGEDVYDYIEVDIGDWLDAQTEFISSLPTTYNMSDNDSGSTTYRIVDGMILDKPSPIASTNYYCGYFAPVSVPLTAGVTNTAYLRNARVDITTTAISGNRVDYDRIVYYNGVVVSSRSTWDNIPDMPTYGLTYFTTNSNLNINVGLWNYKTGYGPGNTADITNIADIEYDSFNWSTGTIDTSVYDGWEAARVKIPNSVSGLSSNWTIPDFLDAINDAWARSQQGQIVIEDTDTPVPPPPVPVPSTPLGDVPFNDWVDLWGQGIYQQLENQSDALDLIGSNGIDAIEELESIDTNTEDLVEVAESIDTNIGVGNGILGGIRSLAQSAVNYLEGIAEHVGELVEEIVEGTETLIAGILNQIPQAFGVIFSPIKQASSIWHYVVEWIQSIGAPFQFIWSMASGTSYYVILPIYASLAAAVVLAFFKRFGR